MGPVTSTNEGRVPDALIAVVIGLVLLEVMRCLW